LHLVTGCGISFEYKINFTFQGKIMNAGVVLITGTSSGFGNLAVPLFLARGWEVVATMRAAQKRGRDLFAQALSVYGNRLHLLELDVENTEHWINAKNYLIENLNGRLDVLVNNAGYGLLGALEDQTMEQLRKQFEVNFFGLAGLTKILLPLLRNHRGRVINISSIGGLVTVPMCGAYNATKFAVEGLTEGLCYELKPFGVQVGLVEPGGFKTEFVGRSLNLAAGCQDPHSAYAALNDILIKALARQTGGDPIVVARKIVQLAECRRLPLRTLVGPDAHMLALLRRILPHNWRVKPLAFIIERLSKRGKKSTTV
jgi:NAD(P)-dependent dehydrogenase (short-subunit alcohol dehydrogenase family)